MLPASHGNVTGTQAIEGGKCGSRLRTGRHCSGDDPLTGFESLAGVAPRRGHDPVVGSWRVRDKARVPVVPLVE